MLFAYEFIYSQPTLSVLILGFSHGKTSFSCSIYFAAEFDTLRRRCGIHQDFVQSLARCNVWNANGGKSKSSFYKTKGKKKRKSENQL